MRDLPNLDSRMTIVPASRSMSSRPRRQARTRSPAARRAAASPTAPQALLRAEARDRDRLLGSTRAAMPDAVAEDLADQQDSHVPARMPGTEYLRDERAGGPRPPRPGKPAGASSGRREMHAQLSPARQAGTAGLRGPLSVARPWSRPPSVAVRAKPTVPRTAPRPRFPSAMRPWTPQYDGLQRYKMTHDGTEKKRPASARIRS
jgi:hypothetical protein